MTDPTTVETVQAVVRDLYQLWPGLDVSVEPRLHVVVRGDGRTTTRPLDVAPLLDDDADRAIELLEAALFSTVRVHKDVHD